MLFFGAFHALALILGFEWSVRAGEGPSLGPYLVSLAVAWVCAMYFTRRRRMSLPSIVLAIVFAIDALAVSVALIAAFLPFDGGLGLSLALLAGAVAMAAFYAVFRLPFALAPLGGLLLALAVATAREVNGAPNVGPIDFPATLFDFAQAPASAVAVLLCGLALFAAALRFDMRDPHRMCRYSAAAFWLHIVAAPAIVNTICLSLYNIGGFAGYASASTAFVGVALVAIAIDRRSFLMAGVVYAGLTLGAAVEAATGEDAFASALTILLLGASIAVLGAKWTAARGALMRALPDFPGKARLPPY